MLNGKLNTEAFIRDEHGVTREYPIGTLVSTKDSSIPGMAQVWLKGHEDTTLSSMLSDTRIDMVYPEKKSPTIYPVPDRSAVPVDTDDIWSYLVDRTGLERQQVKEFFIKSLVQEDSIPFILRDSKIPFMKAHQLVTAIDEWIGVADL